MLNQTQKTRYCVAIECCSTHKENVKGHKVDVATGIMHRTEAIGYELRRGDFMGNFQFPISFSIFIYTF